MNLLLYALIAGLMFGVFFAAVSIGLNLLFGVMRIVNVAQGDMMVWGGYLALTLYEVFHIGPLFAIPLVFVVAVLCGGIAYYGLMPRVLRAPDPSLVSLIVFFGISEILQAVAMIVFGADQRFLPRELLGGDRTVYMFDHAYPVAWFIVGSVSAVIVVLVFAYLYKTRLGYATRAIMSNRGEAASVGINVSRISAINFAIGIGLAAIPGCLVTFIYGNLSPSSGLELTIIAFAVVIIGSMGKPMGALLGGIIYGIATALMQVYLSSWSTFFPNALLLVIMLIRPSGLLGSRAREA